MTAPSFRSRCQLSGAAGEPCAAAAELQGEIHRLHGKVAALQERSGW